MSVTREIAVMGLVLGVLCGLCRSTHAYPQFQSTSGTTRCVDCHVAPAGGGLVNDWGRSEWADSLSHGDSDSFMGNPAPFNGVFDLPSWLRLGGDFRFATIVKDAKDEEPRTLVFPMQFDLYSQFALGDAFSINLTMGMRGAARDQEVTPAQRFVSREHYVMWRPDIDGPYVRAGRFFAPYGLRLPDHTLPIRRRLGFHTLEEPYALSGGIVKDKWEVHATAFTALPFFHAGRKATGAALYYERRLLDDKWIVGGQSQVSFAAEDAQYIVGGVSKYYLESAKLLFMGELNLGVQHFDAGNTKQLQVTSHLGATYFAKPYLMLGASYDNHDADLRLGGSSRNAASVTLQYIPRAHWELIWLSRVEFPALDYASQLHMLMVHYWL